jgi:hypothetical protein
MFVSALKQVEKFTFPVVISTRQISGEVKAGCGAFVILNREGWILTAAHIIQPLLIKEKHKQEIAKYEAEKERIKKNISLSPHRKKTEVEKLHFNPNWITHVSHWWGRDGLTERECYGDELRDIALARLENFNPSEVSTFPTFWNPEVELPRGKSLCKLGFPFHSIDATFDLDTSHFTLAPGSLPIPRFPIEGMHTRVAILQAQNSSRSAEFIEVSTPGLRGQSGGPVFDIKGLVCGIQSRTFSFPLGFSPTIKQGI